MADSTPLLEQIDSSQAEHEVTANALFDAISPASSYGRHAETCTGLTWGYYGTRYGGSAVANGTHACGASTTTYMVVDLTTGAVSFDTATTDWNDDANFGRAYKIVTGTDSVTSYEDHRYGPLGITAAAAVASSGSTAGKHSVFVSAASMYPSVSGGCAPLARVGTASSQPDLVTLDFDATTQEFAQFSIAMPKSWNEGTVTFEPIWSHPATTTNFGVVWQLQGVAVSNDDQIPAAYGAAQTSTDTGGTTDDLYIGPASSAITIGGTPTAEDMVFFRLARNPSDGSDTMAVDARLHGIRLNITTDADTDA